MIRLTRTIEYEYESVEDMVRDLACWSLPTQKHPFEFNGRKRARSEITKVDAVGHEEPPF